MSGGILWDWSGGRGEEKFMSIWGGRIGEVNQVQRQFFRHSSTGALPSVARASEARSGDVFSLTLMFGRLPGKAVF
jgi:hypothetical protein